MISKDGYDYTVAARLLDKIVSKDEYDYLMAVRLLSWAKWF